MTTVLTMTIALAAAEARLSASSPLSRCVEYSLRGT
jgi:hypothetical protein